MEFSNRPADPQHMLAVNEDFAFSLCPLDYASVQKVIAVCNEIGLLMDWIITISENCDFSMTKIRFAAYHAHWPWQQQEQSLKMQREANERVRAGRPRS